MQGYPIISITQFVPDIGKTKLYIIVLLNFNGIDVNVQGYPIISITQFVPDIGKTKLYIIVLLNFDFKSTERS